MPTPEEADATWRAALRFEREEERLYNMVRATVRAMWDAYDHAKAVRHAAYVAAGGITEREAEAAYKAACREAAVAAWTARPPRSTVNTLPKESP